MKVLFAGQIPKDPAFPEEIEDALNVSEECRIALSDGASESFDSKAWASLLANGYIAQPQFDGQWVQDRIRDYTDKFDVASLSWSKRAAFERGSFATLLCIQQDRESNHAEVLAIGDSIAVFCDGNEFVDSFPYSYSEQFDQHPELLSTNDALNADFESSEFILYCKRNWNSKGMLDPVVILMTDALGQWALRSAEQGLPPWRLLAGIDDVSTLQSLVNQEREAKRMRTDDVTLINISLTETNSDGVPVS